MWTWCESVGGAVFDLAVDALATRGRLIVIGFVSDHQTPAGLSPEKAGTLPAKLRKKSASIQGFFLNHCLPARCHGPLAQDVCGWRAGL